MNKYLKKMHSILELAWPAVIQEAMTVIVQYVDTAMVGTLGASASAAVGLTGSVNWLIGNIAVGFGVGVLAVCSKASGAKDEKKVKIAGQQSIFIMSVIGVVLTAIALLISPVLPAWLNGDVSIRKEASLYFMIVSIPLFFKTAVIILSSTLRSVKDMKTPMRINLYMNIINVIFNFLLIYPTRKIMNITVWGANLGVMGAAIGTAISFFIGGILILLHFYNNPIFDFKHTGFHFHKSVCLECITIGFPVVMERSVICLGHVIFASLIAKLGVVSLAAHTIAIQAEQAFYIPGYGFQSAASTLVGNAIGERNETKVKETTYLISAMTFTLMFIAGIILFIFANQLMSFFTADKAVIVLGALVLRIVSISEPIYGVLVILEGTFNGMGDTKAPFVFSILTMWGIRILGSYIMISFFHFGLESVWIMMVLDNVGRCLLLTQRFLRKKWIYRIEV